MSLSEGGGATSGERLQRDALVMMKFIAMAMLVLLSSASGLPAQSPNDVATPLPSPSIPAGPRPTATVTPLQASPQPTATITPLPSASPGGTQPITTNTVTPTPTPDE